MFQKARHWGFVAEGALNPVEGVDRFPEVKRRRFVSKDEMPKLAKAIDQEDNIFVRALIWLYLFTGLRKTELLSLRWSEVDLVRGMVSLEDTKAGRPHDLPLSSAAVWVLEQVPKVARNPHVFVGHRRGHHVVNVSKPWQRIRERAELLDVRLHDLRRTVGSWMAISGSSLPLIGSVLNHSNPQTTQVYARFSMDPVQEALERHGRQIRAASGLHDLSTAPEASPAPGLTASSAGSVGPGVD
jgi:integrase